jgi:hypothetical protein
VSGAGRRSSCGMESARTEQVLEDFVIRPVRSFSLVRSALGVLHLVALLACVGAADARIEGEFQLNTWVAGDQERPAVASHPAEGWVAVWQSGEQDGDCYGVYGRLFAPEGEPDGEEFRVNVDTIGCQMFPRIDSDPTGRFVVVWQSWGQDGSGYGIFGRRFDDEGTPLGPPFQINIWTAGNQERPAVATQSDGSFLVVWQSSAQDGSSYGVYGQEFDEEGNPTGEEFGVNVETEGWQGNPDLAIGPAGTWVVVWESENGDGNGFGILARRFGAAGIPLGPEIAVNEHLINDQILPSAGVDSQGNLIVVWSSEDQDGHRFGVYARRFSSELVPLGEEFQVNTYTYKDQMGPSVAVTPDGQFAVLWMSSFQDGSGLGVFGQVYLANGQPLGSEFQVNEYTDLYQSFPRAACDTGCLVIVWQSDVQDGDGYGIWARAYQMAELGGDSERIARPHGAQHAGTGSNLPAKE